MICSIMNGYNIHDRENLCPKNLLKGSKIRTTSCEGDVGDQKCLMITKSLSKGCNRTIYECLVLNILTISKYYTS